jgi:hypothetical protein
LVVSEADYQIVAFWLAVIVCVLGFAAGVVVWISNFRAPWQLELLRDHYAAIIGLPSSAAGAFVIVTFFRQVAGPIKLSGFGLSVEGAGGPVILWAVCFLVMTIAIKMIWPLKS